MEHGRPTVKTVAERAGVSTASVSRVLNGLPTRPETVRRVEQAVAELSYAPTAAARSLKLGSSGQVACAFSDIGNPVYVEMITAIEQVVSEAGLRLVIHSTHADSDLEERIVRGLAMGYADGLIISPLRPTGRLVSILSGCTQPVVAIGNLSGRADVDAVRVDSRQAVRQVLEHLRDQGAERIGFVNGPRDTTPGQIRARAFREHQQQQGRSDSELESRMVSGTDFTRSAGLLATEELLARGPLDAIFCATDTLAGGALRVLTEAGLVVPRDVLVASIDDTELAELTTPRLTSASLRAAERGAIAARLLLDRLSGEAVGPARRRSLRPELTIRESSLREPHPGRKS